jgi:hypothetical protein
MLDTGGIFESGTNGYKGSSFVEAFLLLRHTFLLWRKRWLSPNEATESKMLGEVKCHGTKLL